MLSSYRRAVVTLLRTVRVSAIGCALTHELTEGMSFQVIRNAETAVIKCAHSNQHWPLVCTGDRWQGSVGQCAPQGQSGQRLATISLWIQINISDIFVAWGWHLYQLVTGTWCGYSRNAVIITFSYPRRSNLLSLTYYVHDNWYWSHVTLFSMRLRSAIVHVPGILSQGQNWIKP